MNKSFSIESKENGELIITFTVGDKREVDRLTLELMAYCDDVLYEPKNQNSRYESCILCNERISFKIETSEV